MKCTGSKAQAVWLMIAGVLFTAATAFGSVPRTMNCQGYLTDESGRPVNGAVSMAFALYNVESGGSALWTETHQNVTVTNGVYGVVLGDGTPAPVPIVLPFDQPYYLGITVGTDNEMAPRLALTSAGYSLRAAAADHAGSASGVSIATGAGNGKVLTSDDSGVGSWQTPAGDSAKVAKAGDTMTGTLTITQSAPSGNGATIQKTHPANSGHALYVTTNGPGTGHGVYSLSTGLSRAGFFEISNPANGGEAVLARTNGTGQAFHGTTTGSNSAGIFSINNPVNSADALYVITNGTGNAGNFNGKVNVSGTITSTGFRLTASPASGYVLTSDASGTGTWQPANGLDNTKVFKTGDTMTGPLAINQGAASGAAATIQITTPANTSPAIEASTSGAGAAVRGTNSGTAGPAGYFQITNSNSAAHALQVATNGTGYGHGIYSYSTGLSRAGFFEINNPANGGEALFARTNGTASAVHGNVTGTGNAGVFDIMNASNSADALYVATDGTGRSGYFQNSNASSPSDALYATTNGTGNAIKGFTTGSGYSGFFQGGAGLFVAGNLNVTGSLTKGSGSFVQPHKKDPSKEIVYAFFEGPEHAIFFRGKAKLADGRAVIETPEHFRDVAGSDEDITVQFTPRSSRSKGLAAVEVTKDSIRVEELMEGKGTYEFDYFITAKRAGFEGHEPVQKNTHFSAHNGTQEEFERRYAEPSDMTVRAMRDMLIASGILTEDGRLNREVAERLGWKVKDREYALK